MILHPIPGFCYVIMFAFLPMKLDPKLRKALEAIMKERPPMDAQVPIEWLITFPFPNLVVSLGWLEAFKAVCTKHAMGMGARRVIIHGAGHSVHRTG